MRGAILHLLTLCLLLASSDTADAGDSRLVWRTIDTDHFVITYYEPNGDLAHHVAMAAERSHQLLTPALRHVPRGKTHIVVLDNTDGANGFASVAPRNQIVVFVSAPGSLSNLNDHDDWLFGLVLHEYAHIVHLDTTSGLPALWNKIWGKNWMPNQIQPRWMVEGLATYEEGKRTSGGRTRNAMFDMFLRLAVLEGKHHTLDVTSSVPRNWPGGNVAYLYGSHFLKFIADKYGDDVIAEISHSYGGHPIPWNFGRAIPDRIGKTVDELYSDWRAFLHRRYALQKAAVERRGLIDGIQMSDTGLTNAAPRYSADGSEVFWIRSDGYTRGHVRRMPAAGHARDGKVLAKVDGAGSFDVLPDGSGFVAARGYTYRTNYSFSDLVHYDFASNRVTRLTRGLRAREPDMSPDGRRVAFVVNGRSKSKLAMMPLVHGAQHQILWAGQGRFDQVSTPAWSPDGKTIAFSAWTEGGVRDLYLYDLAAKKATRLTHDRAIDVTPRWSPDGKWLYFTSDRSGIYNLYAIDPHAKKMWQITNLLGGVFTFDVSPTGEQIAYSGFDDDGFEIFRIDLDDSKWLRPELYVNDRPPPVRIKDEFAISEPRDYRPLETLAPNLWRAALSVDSFGSAVTLTTGGNDVAGIHAYSLGVTLGITRGDVSVGASYAYNRLWPRLGLSVGRGIRRPGGLVIDGQNMRFTQEAYSFTANIGLPLLRHPSYSSTMSLAYDFDWFRNIDGEATPDPQNPVPRIPATNRQAGLALRWSFADVRRYGFTVGAQEGRAFGVGVRYNHPNLGSEVKSVVLSYSWQQFFAMPWPGHHSLAFRQVGGIQAAEDRRAGQFSLGGIPNQNVYDAVINSTRVGNTGYLRGYQPGAIRGSQFHLTNLEYRLPIYEIERGVSTLPFFVRRLHFAALFDAGGAFDDEFDFSEYRVSVGASLRLEVSFGFFIGGTFDLGISRGLHGEDGVTQYWFLLTNLI